MGNIGNVQTNGLPNVTTMFEHRGIEAWSLWQGKQFLHKGIGGEDLHAFLEMISKSGTNPVYTIKVYEKISDPVLIKSNTPDDGSFNFRLLEASESPFMNYNNAIISKLAAIEQRLNEKDDEPPGGRLGIIGELLDHPVIEQLAPMIIGRIMDAMGTKKPVQPPQQYRQPQYFERPAAIAGPDEEALLNQAIEVLKKYDPNLAEHLTKLSAIAESDPASFKFLLKTLDNM